MALLLILACHAIGNRCCRHLAAVGQKEVLADFAALAQEPVDEAAVKERIRQVKAKEAQARAAGAPGGGGGIAAGTGRSNLR
jgi:hypothetical protein